MIAQSTVEQVRGYHDIVAVISDYVTLKKRGRNYIGLCPFHPEKTPSFTVSPDKHLWHCFGCQTSGDHIGFIMKVDNLSFTDAIVHIAQKAGIEVIHEEKPAFITQEEQRLKAYWEIMTDIGSFFETQLSNSPAQSYALSRGLKPDTLQRFHIGFGGSNPNLLSFIEKKQLSLDTLAQLGVVFRAESGDWVSRFRGRLLFPIFDDRGRLSGWGGRLLDESAQAAKYINTEETPLFNKRKLLYGLHMAKSAIRKAGYVIVMEGYMDVVVAHQSDVANVVGTMGTALTHEQAAKIKRETDVVYLALDADASGQAAIEKSFDTLRPFDLTIKVVTLSGKDPAEMLLSDNGKEQFLKAVEDAIPSLEFLIRRQVAQWTGQVEDVSKHLAVLLPLVQKEPDPLIKRHYIKRISDVFNVDKESVLVKLNNLRYNSPQTKFPKIQKKDKFNKAEEFLIFLMATSLHYRSRIFQEISPQDFISDDLRQLAAIIKECDSESRLLVMQIPDPGLQHRLSCILVEGDDVSPSFLFERDGMDCVHTLLAYKTEQRVKEIKTSIMLAEQKGKDEEVLKLLEDLKDLLHRP